MKVKLMIHAVQMQVRHIHAPHEIRRCYTNDSCIKVLSVKRKSPYLNLYRQLKFAYSVPGINIAIQLICNFRYRADLTRYIVIHTNPIKNITKTKQNFLIKAVTIRYLHTSLRFHLPKQMTMRVN